VRGKKARAIRKQYGIKHVRLARPRIIRDETPNRDRLIRIKKLPLMVLNRRHLNKLREEKAEKE
jgi:hypothetical protein